MRQQKYPLTRQAEMLFAYATCVDPRFFEVLSHAVDPDRLPSDDARLLVSAAQEINRNTGTPPASSVAVVQQLRLRVNAGKLSLEDLQTAADLLDAVEDAGGVTDKEGLLGTVTPAIKSVAGLTAVEETVAQVGQGLDPAAVADKFTAVASLGQARVSMGTKLDFTVQQITAATQWTTQQRLPTGIPDLDVLLGGGVERAALGVFLGNPGDGKSLALCHVAGESLWEGLNVAYVTLELSELQIIDRIMCNTLNMTTGDMANNPQEAVRRRGLRSTFGDLRVLYLTPKVSTVAQIAQWLKDLKRTSGFDPDVLLVDYADKLGARAASEAKGSYQAQGEVYERLRGLIVDRPTPIWGWTASQTTGRQGRKKKLDIEDIADSMEKARICDTLVAIMRNEDDVQQGLVRFRLPKRRNGAAHQETQPTTMDPEHGRIVVCSRVEPW